MAQGNGSSARQTTAFPESNGRRCVLLVEGDPDLRRIIRVTLEGASVRLLEAHDPLVALEAAAQEIPDVVLLDVSNEGESAFEAAYRLRSDARTSGIRLVLLAARGQDSEVEAGGFDFLVKPFAPHDLLCTLQLADPQPDPRLH